MIYYFYMQQTDKDGVVVADSQRNLESDFTGLRYVACKGLSSVGKPKNIYTENYAEQDGFRTFYPGDTNGVVVHEATNIELDLIFVGEDRRSTYDSFCAYVESNRLYYWDTARHRKVWLALIEAVEPTDDTLKGEPYIRATFKFTNLWGEGRSCNDSGTLDEA